MATKLGPKQLLMITYFLKGENKWATPKELKEYFKEEISGKTITNTLKCNDKDKTAPFFLFNITVTGRGLVYQLRVRMDTFTILAENYLKSSYSSIFFESRYAQLFLKNNKEKLLKKVTGNLRLDVDNESREKIWDAILKSPSALKYGLFGEMPENQTEFFENLIFSMLTDLKNKEFYFPGEFVNKDDFLQLISIKIKIDEHIGYKKKIKKNEFDFNYYP